MNRFRSWSRRACILHGYLIAMLIVLPVQRGNSYWTDSDTDGTNDTWVDLEDGSRTRILTALDAQDVDIDHDGAYNSEELFYGGNPYVYDTDNDGLNDGDEIHLAIQNGLRNYALTNWDSNGDGVSDHDDFYNFSGVTYPGGQLPGFNGASYSDYDGDGIKNPFDPYPADPTNNDADDDGLDNNVDPAPNDNSNTSSYNSRAWNGSALGDDDSDLVLNFYDLLPDDDSNGNNDGDVDGLANQDDPYPHDAANRSPLNRINWYGTLFGDADADGTVNHLDAWPYDSSNGTSATADGDADGLQNSLDPAPTDPDNFSAINQTNWRTPLEDADNDGTNNFNDPFPLDTYDNITDFDGDGLDNAAEPFPKDAANYSSLNQTAWYATLFDDADVDGIPNWQDEFPNDTFNNIPDFDGDGIANASDPYPKDAANFSDVNSTSWGVDALGDADNDGTPNWNDTTPYPVVTDADNDSIDDSIDPYPGNSSNHSDINGLDWGANVIGDNDNDGIVNWNDADPLDSDGDTMSDGIDPVPNGWYNYSPSNDRYWYYGSALVDSDNDGVNNWWDGWPDDGNNGQPQDSDGDGIPDSNDPVPYDSSNPSSNGYAWPGASALADDDNDGTANWWDAWPYDANNGTNFDRDGDGIANESDPAPDDFANYSSYNWYYWYGSALGDNDNDGTANFYDYQPNGDGNVDSDGDGYYDSNDPAPGDNSNYSSTNQQWWYQTALNDNDGDDTLNFFDATPYGPPPPPDNDGDGLDANAEQAWGTSDDDRDSDDDGLSDGEEVNIYGTHPANAHSRSQTYTDWEMVDTTDSDGDRIPDRIEQHYGLNPGWGGDALLDRDNDGMNNLAQYNAGIALDLHLSSYDADGDGMTDVFEDAYAQVLAKSNPDDAVLDADNDGVLNYEEQILLTSPVKADTLQQGGLGDLQWLMLSVRYPDGSNPPDTDSAPANGIPDWADAVKEIPTAPDYYHFTRTTTDDLDGDGMPDAWEHEYGRWKFTANGLQLRLDDAGGDADGDGLSNLFEYLLGTSPLAGDSDGNGTSDDNEDKDHDGLTNAQEMALGTSPIISDTDGDGVSDAQEMAEGTDPLSASSNITSLIGLRVFTRLEGMD